MAVQSAPSNINLADINISLLSTFIIERISPYENSLAYINFDIIPRWYHYQHKSDFTLNSMYPVDINIKIN